MRRYTRKKKGHPREKYNEASPADAGQVQSLSWITKKKRPPSPKKPCLPALEDEVRRLQASAIVRRGTHLDDDSGYVFIYEEDPIIVNGFRI